MIRIQYQPDTLTFADFKQVDEACFPGEPLTPEAFADAQNDDFWAAYQGQTFVGYAIFRRKPALGWFARLGTVPAYRGQGIGSQLLQTAVAHCRRLGLPEIMLYVRSDNDPARRLYERFSFHITETSYQFLLSVNRLAEREGDGGITAVPLPAIPPHNHPTFPDQWRDIHTLHQPPQQYVFIFQNEEGRQQGYGRLTPGFPGCFPFVIDRPAQNLWPALQTLRPYLLPGKKILKLTLTGEELAAACRANGLTQNYRIFKMVRRL